MRGTTCPWALPGVALPWPPRTPLTRADAQECRKGHRGRNRVASPALGRISTTEGPSSEGWRGRYVPSQRGGRGCGGRKQVAPLTEEGLEAKGHPTNCKDKPWKVEWGFECRSGEKELGEEGKAQNLRSWQEGHQGREGRGGVTNLAVQP